MIYTNSTTNYTNIDTQKSVHFAVPRTETRLKNALDLYMKYRSYAEHCRPCTRLSGVNWCLQITGQSRLLGPDSSVLTLG